MKSQEPGKLELMGLDYMKTINERKFEYLI